ncbi:TRAP transporter small permease [Thalassorhabdomicrobium marinisediminis]|uniref:TRAP transporter small permease protein n=1 Tax=Thalassorhabdomicrobium marinisediminis TaxID=2170577 RepID=A0A2T7FXF3_9RHOB|nr:TRAP transporter small permease [Thalassorhabdomicrobium marinisediminis]PVA06808.1 TRAP transporter permease DctQ [Thalassorhabdomicrobium marinisediminis]
MNLPDNRGLVLGVDQFERIAIAVLLGLMTLTTFANVVLRYIFNSTLIWGLEVTLILFAWLVLFGMSYCVKVTAHLGVDALLNVLPSRARFTLTAIAGLACLIYAALLLKGAWDYWAPYAALNRTSGRWLPTGFAETRSQAWYLTDQVPMPAVLSWLEPLINMGERYDRLPRVVGYTMLPVGVALLLFRLLQAFYELLQGVRSSFIVSHEVEAEVAEAQARLKSQET